MNTVINELIFPTVNYFRLFDVGETRNFIAALPWGFVYVYLALKFVGVKRRQHGPVV